MKIRDVSIRNKEWLFYEYVELKKSVKQIRRETGLGINTIKRWLRYFEIPLRDINDEIIRKQRGNVSGNKNHHWLGKRNLGGYIYSYFPEHPDSNQDGYMAQHRIVAEQILGRYIRKDEVVHHINGDRADNDKSNLFPTDRSGHRRATASLVSIGFQLVKDGRLHFDRNEGVYKWI